MKALIKQTRFEKEKQLSGKTHNTGHLPLVLFPTFHTTSHAAPASFVLELA